MKKIGSGHKSDVFSLDDGRILKLFVPEFADLATEEAEIARVLESAGVNSPRYDEDVVIDGRPGIIFTNLSVGRTISAAVRKEPWRITEFARKLAEMHIEVHRCRSPSLPSQRERLAQEIASGINIEADVKQAAARALEALPDGDVVCHNDIHMLNVIVHPANSKIIDWMLATCGNPDADVASAVLQLRFGERPGGRVAGAALEIGRSLFWRSYLRHYLRARPQASDGIRQWELPVAVALAGRREGRMREQLLRRITALLPGFRVRSADADS